MIDLFKEIVEDDQSGKKLLKINDCRLFYDKSVIPYLV